MKFTAIQLKMNNVLIVLCLNKNFNRLRKSFQTWKGNQIGHWTGIGQEMNSCLDLV
jgi:hypothetical protein